MFWLWFLSGGRESITLPVDDSAVVVTTNFLSAEATFGIPADKKSIIEIIDADHEIDWSEFEATDENDIEEAE